MKLLILGATGGSGLRLIDEALRRGHEVTAFVRSPQKLADSDKRLVVCVGDLLNPDSLSRAVSGAEAVLSAFGPRTFRPSPAWQQFGQSVVQAMSGTQTRRLLLTSVALLFPDIGTPGFVLSRTIFRNTRRGAAAMERVVEASHLQWTIVRPPRLTNEARTGRYRVRENRLPGFSISRADLAVFMLDEVEQGRYIRKIVGVAG